ncbi:hypothetical protein [Conexibacter sp. SYSU D00693]|uniref:hypothetical protein n=1 Tax=Conexibacter sp. SYSU D00693 TaxID=2812560 RepID=UPI00196B8245|nr:hypothetical protein [Conexibacter sp. SYSU D00693]
MDARSILLREAIDDAGLFPPARKPLARAVADHGAARRSAAGWMLGRFLCPVSRLREAAGVVRARWPLGVVLDAAGGDWLTGVRSDLALWASSAGSASATAFELRLPHDAVDRPAITDLVTCLERAGVGDRIVFLEVPGHDPDTVRAALASIARTAGGRRLGAKLRCGGVVAEAFPPSCAVATFIDEARRLGLPFKATAGLHHPFRTREAALGVLQHGFVNLLAATALVEADPLEVVEEKDPSAFHIDADGLAWRDHRADAAALAAARRRFVAFGSCSFDEPVADLGLVLDGATP